MGKREETSFLSILHAAVPLTRSILSITVDERRKTLRAVYLSLYIFTLNLCTNCNWSPAFSPAIRRPVSRDAPSGFLQSRYRSNTCGPSESWMNTAPNPRGDWNRTPAVWRQHRTRVAGGMSPALTVGGLGRILAEGGLSPILCQRRHHTERTENGCIGIIPYTERYWKSSWYVPNTSESTQGEGLGVLKPATWSSVFFPEDLWFSGKMPTWPFFQSLEQRRRRLGLRFGAEGSSSHFFARMPSSHSRQGSGTISEPRAQLCQECSTERFVELHIIKLHITSPQSSISVWGRDSIGLPHVVYTNQTPQTQAKDIPLMRGRCVSLTSTVNVGIVEWNPSWPTKHCSADITANKFKIENTKPVGEALIQRHDMTDGSIFSGINYWPLTK